MLSGKEFKQVQGFSIQESARILYDFNDWMSWEQCAGVRDEMKPSNFFDLKSGLHQLGAMSKKSRPLSEYISEIQFIN